MPDELQDVAIKPHMAPEYEMFASFIAAGSSASEAAELAGFARNYASDLANRPEVQARIGELIELQAKETEAFGGIVTRRWIESQLVVIVQHSMRYREAKLDAEGKVKRPARDVDFELARRTLMDLAKLKGMVIDRKQSTNATVTATVSTDAMQTHLAGFLDQLEPGARKQIERRLTQVEQRKQKSRVIDAPAADTP